MTERTFDKARMAALCRVAATAAYEASEAAYELQLRETQLKLLDFTCQLHQLARDLLELPQRPPAPEQQKSLPF